MLGVLWPSKKFADDELMLGGGASLGGEVDDRTLREQLEGLKGTFDAPDEAALEQAKALVAELEADPARAGSSSIWCARSCPRRRIRPTTPPTSFSSFPASRSSICSRRRSCRGRPWAAAAAGVLRRSGSPRRAAAGMMGGAAGIGDLFSGIKAAARRVLNFATSIR